MSRIVPLVISNQDKSKERRLKHNWKTTPTLCKNSFSLKCQTTYEDSTELEDLLTRGNTETESYHWISTEKKKIQIPMWDRDTPEHFPSVKLGGPRTLLVSTIGLLITPETSFQRDNRVFTTTLVVFWSYSVPRGIDSSPNLSVTEGRLLLSYSFLRSEHLIPS